MGTDSKDLSTGEDALVVDVDGSGTATVSLFRESSFSFRFFVGFDVLAVALTALRSFSASAAALLVRKLITAS